MRKTILLALFFAVAYSIDLSLDNFIIEKETLEGNLNDLFLKYCLHFNKAYCVDNKSILKEIINNNISFDNSEINRRKIIFKENVFKLIEHNKINKDYKVGLTIFTDMTIDELKDKFLNEPMPLKDINPNFLKSLGLVEQKRFKKIDWRDKDIFLPIRNQGECGSCWAFSSVGVIESLRALEFGKKEYLSTQELVSCDDKEKGCKGGWASIAYSYISKNGIVSENSYPYEEKDSPCNTTKTKNIAVEINRDINRCDEEECMQNDKQYEFLLKGPVAVVIDAYNTLFFNYKSGYYSESCAEPNHAIILVGYGIDEKTNVEYWIIRNSWGESWGMEGYGYVKRNDSNNYSCNVNRYGYQPIIKSSK